MTSHRIKDIFNLVEVSLFFTLLQPKKYVLNVLNVEKKIIRD